MKLEKFDFNQFKDIVLSNIEDKNLLFHCSPIAGLTELKANPSFAYKKGTQPCVFASYHLNSILFYGSKTHKGDLDGQYGINNDSGKTYFYEAYEDSLKKIYDKEKCYIYIVDKEHSHFEENQTSYSAEVVDGTGQNVKLLKCYEVENTYELMQEFQKYNLLNLFYYRDFGEKEHARILKHQIRLVDFYQNHQESYGWKFCLEHFSEAIDQLKIKESQQIHT